MVSWWRVRVRLPGRAKPFFHDGNVFLLSDHSGVLALASVSAAHRGTAGVGIVRDLLAVLARARDREAGAEAHVCNERLREGRARAALMKARKEDRERGVTIAETRRAKRAVMEHRKALRVRAFGPESLFRDAAYKDARRCVQGVGAPASMQLFDGQDGIVVQELAVGRYPTIGGFRCEPWASYIAAVCQVLVRTPLVAALLDAHVAHCAVGADEVDQRSSKCVTCALANSRERLGKGGVPALVTHRAMVDGRFEDVVGHCAALFLGRWLDAARVEELRAGRAVAWDVNVADPRATLVDGTFGFLLEKCWRCHVCGLLSVSVEPSMVLPLQVPKSAETETRTTITDLYMSFVGARDVVRHCQRCGGDRTHVEQRLVSGNHNVVVVHVQRGAGEGGEMAKGMVEVDERLSLTYGVELDLVGAVYSVGGGVGEKAGNGRCVALSRGPDGMYWVFDREHCRRLRMAVTEVLPRSVNLLVYAHAQSWAGEHRVAASRRNTKRDYGRVVNDAAGVAKAQSESLGTAKGACARERSAGVDRSGVRALTRTLSQCSLEDAEHDGRAATPRTKRGAARGAGGVQDVARCSTCGERTDLSGCLCTRTAAAETARAVMVKQVEEDRGARPLAYLLADCPVLLDAMLSMQCVDAWLADPGLAREYAERQGWLGADGLVLPAARSVLIPSREGVVEQRPSEQSSRADFIERMRLVASSTPSVSRRRLDAWPAAFEELREDGTRQVLRRRVLQERRSFLENHYGDSGLGDAHVGLSARSGVGSAPGEGLARWGGGVGAEGVDVAGAEEGEPVTVLSQQLSQCSLESRTGEGEPGRAEAQRAEKNR